MQLEKGVTVWECLVCEKKTTQKPLGFGSPNGDWSNQAQHGQEDHHDHHHGAEAERACGADDLLGFSGAAQSARAAERGAAAPADQPQRAAAF